MLYYRTLIIGVTQDFVCCRVIRRAVAGLFVGLVGWLAARQHGNCEDDRPATNKK